eukprot:6206072-Pleurochrysis_carterae.AAC.1
MCRNIEFDKPQSRAFFAKPSSNPPRDRDVKASTGHKQNARGDPARNARDSKSKATSGAWTWKDYVKCRHCGGTHWHRDCPKRRKSVDKTDKGKAHSVRAAEVLVSAAAAQDAAQDAALDDTIGNVLLASDARSRSIDVGKSFCVRRVNGDSDDDRPLSSIALAEQDAKQLAVSEALNDMRYEFSDSNSDRSRYPDSDAEKDPDNPEELIPFVNICWPDEEFCDEHVWREAIALHNRKTADRCAKRKAIADLAADHVDDALFALRRIRRLEPLDFQETFSAHRSAVLDNTSFSHAHVQAELANQRDKLARLQERAEYDGYARYRDIPRLTKYNVSGLHVGGLVNVAKADRLALYNTGEPHPCDPERWFLTGYVDAITGWQMFRYDGSYVQPENGSPGLPTWIPKPPPRNGSAGRPPPLILPTQSTRSLSLPTPSTHLTSHAPLCPSARRARTRTPHAP